LDRSISIGFSTFAGPGGTDTIEVAGPAAILTSTTVRTIVIAAACVGL
jgi:hypothetical protein